LASTSKKFLPLPQNVGVEAQTTYKQHSAYQHHPFARNAVKFQHFLMK